MGQHIQASTVCHADEDDADPGLGRRIDELIQHGDHHVKALDGEACLARIQAVQEQFERFHLGQPLEQLDFVHILGRVTEASGLGGLVQPVALLW